LTSNSISFISEGISFELLNSSIIQEWLLQTIDKEEASLGFVNFIFCSDEYLLKINQEHLGHDYYTDVIGFPYSTDPIEGDIFISIDRVKENAKDLGIEFNNELHRIMIHGLLHFLGYLDKNPDDKEMMTKKENYYLDQLSV